LFEISLGCKLISWTITNLFTLVGCLIIEAWLLPAASNAVAEAQPWSRMIHPVQSSLLVAQGSSVTLRLTDPVRTVTVDRLDQCGSGKSIVGSDKPGQHSDLPFDGCLQAREARADPAVDKMELPIKYLGNCFSGKFHRPSCPFAKAMNARHVVFFHFRREAIERGQKPCRYCLPAVVKRLEGKLLPRGNREIVTSSPADLDHSGVSATKGTN